MYTCRSTLHTNKKDKPDEFITMSELHHRGWTKKLIDDFAGEPDKTAKNPVYKRSSPMKLYSLKRIKGIERTKKFKTAIESAKKRKETAKKGANTKRQQTLDYANTVRISIPEYTKEELIEEACDAYNEWYEYKAEIYNKGYDFTPATNKSDNKFLSRICTNYLRHQCTNYEEDLQKMYGNVGVQEGHDILQKRINEAIFEKYPWIDKSYLQEEIV